MDIEKINSKVTSLQIQLTTECNERCIFCRKYTWKSKHILFDTIVEKVEKYKNANLQFSGGEPTMYNELEKLNRLLIEQNKKYKVFTNGLLPGTPAADVFVEYADQLSISLDAMSNVVYNEVRRPLEKEFALDRVKYLARKFYYKSRVCMVVTSQNIEQVLPILHFAMENGIKSRFYPIHTNTEGMIPSKLQLEVLSENLGKVNLHGVDTNVTGIVQEGFYDTNTKFIPCFVREYSRLVDEDGREYFCCYAINDNGLDIDGKNEIDKANINVYTPYDYCDHCTRYRHANETGIIGDYL